jgi:hypothetical protein
MAVVLPSALAAAGLPNVDIKLANETNLTDASTSLFAFNSEATALKFDAIEDER